jgi:hypothetical protein
MSKPAIRKVFGDKMLTEMKAAAASTLRRRVPGGAEVVNDVTKRRRFELLDLDDEADLARWQVLHNDAHRYEVLSEKFSHVKGVHEAEHTCAVVYLELGEDLPLVKTRGELRSQDSKAARNSKIRNEYDIEAFDAES